MRFSLRAAGIISGTSLFTVVFIAGLDYFSVMPLSMISVGVSLLPQIVVVIWYLRKSIDDPFQELFYYLESRNVAGLERLGAGKNDFGRIAAFLARAFLREEPGRNAATKTEVHPDTVGMFRNLIENAADAIIIIDAKGTITFCNQCANIIFGNDIGGADISSLVAADHGGDLMRRLRDAVQNRETGTFEFTMAKKDGTAFNAELTVSAISDASGLQGACSIFLRDISSRKMEDEQKQIVEQQLRAVYKMEALGQMARGIAHDLNNSLGAISGYVELIKKTVPQGDERTRKYATMIASATQRSSGIIHQLMTYARKSHMQIISFDVNEVIVDIAKLLESSLDKNITIVQELRAGDSTIIGDPGQIQNAIVNLALNARDAMPRGGTLTLTTDNIVIDEEFAKSRPFTMTQGYYLTIVVRDTGSGMTEEVKRHLFEPFFTTKEIGKGTGLGLASVYGSLKSHNGYVEVDTTEQKGSAFTLFLPVNQAHPSIEDTAADGSLPDNGKHHLMIVDDDQALREMLVELLAWLGYTVTPFANAEASIEFYTGHHETIDMVILDWKMPGMDGIECFRKLKTINPSIKALIATGYCLEDERQEILKVGFAGILPKPFVSAVLSRAIADVLS